MLNVQGDVVGLLNAAGELVVEYEYDPWGKLLSTYTYGEAPVENEWYRAVAEINPLRYRGYYYDTETGFYYLQSRYYDPAIGRFINADTYTTTDASSVLSTNMFAYCENNPVNRSDPDGEIWNIVVGAVVGGGLELAKQLISGKSLSEVNWTKVGVSALSGGLTAAVGPAAGAVISGATDVAMDAIDGNISSFSDAAKSFAWGTAKAFTSYGISSAIGKAAKSLTRIEQVGKIGKAGYPGIKYSYNKGKGRAIRSIEIHSRHNNHGVHLQVNKWNPKTGTRSGASLRITLWR